MRPNILAVAGLALLLAACADSRESVTKQALSGMEEQVALLRTVTDAESAARAVDGARRLGARQAEIQRRMEGFGEPTPEEQRKLKDAYAGRLAEVSQELLREAMRVAFVPGGSEVLRALQAGK